MDIRYVKIHPTKPNGFADHYPYEMAISLGILTQHFQLPTHIRYVKIHPWVISHVPMFHITQVMGQFNTPCSSHSSKNG